MFKGREIYVHDRIREISILETDVNKIMESDKYMFVSLANSKPGSSGSIVSGYGLDDRAIGVRFPGETKGFFL
jgi:hypothetical protein